MLAALLLLGPIPGSGLIASPTPRVPSACDRWARDRSARAALLSASDGGALEPEPLAVGDRVRITAASLEFKHVPGHKQGFDAAGAIGTVVRIYGEGNLSPNRPVKVEFDEPKKWVAHFDAHELETVDSGGDAAAPGDP